MREKRRDLGGVVCVALFWLLSAAFFSEPLFTGGVLVPVNPRQWHPWASADPSPGEQTILSNPLMGDSLMLTYPWRLYNHQMLRSGEIPFWNPYIFGGYPHLAALQSHALHPLTVVFDLWDPIGGIAYSMALHLALAGTLMFWFLRRLGLEREAATFGGVIFELNGFFLVRMSAPSYVFTGVWVPLLFLGIYDLVKGAGWRSAWKIVLATFFAFLGGHPQIFVLLILMGLGYAVVLTWPKLEAAGGPRTLIVTLFKLAIAIGLGMGMAGFQLLPFLELVQETVRGPVEFGSYQKLALPVVSLIQAVVPDFFGHPVDGSYWFSMAAPFIDRAPQAELVWQFNYCGENLFTGVTPLVFALFSLLLLSSRQTLYFGFLAAVALLVLFGSPLLRPFYLLVPTFQYSRADRIIYVYMFAISALAALGYSGVSRWATYKSMGVFARSTAKAMVVSPLLLALWPLLFDSELRAGYRKFLSFAWEHIEVKTDVLVPQMVEATMVGLCSLGLILLLKRRSKSQALVLPIALLLVVVPLFRFGWRFNPVQPQPLFPDSSVIARLQEEAQGLQRIARLDNGLMLPANTGQVFGLFDVNGASAAAIEGYARLIGAADPGAIKKEKHFRSFRSPEVLNHALLDFLNVELMLSKREHPLPELANAPADSAFRIYRNPDRLPRFFLVDRVERYEAVEEGIQKFLDPGFAPGRVALVEPETDFTPAANTGDDTGGMDLIKLVSYRAHEIELAVRADGERLLVSSEVDYPGWEAYVDDVRVEKVLVNTAFRGVVVPAGVHRVGFRYVPRSFYLGLLVSFLSCGIFTLSLSHGSSKCSRFSLTRSRN